MHWIDLGMEILNRQINGQQQASCYIVDEEYCAKVKNPRQEDLEGLIVQCCIHLEGLLGHAGTLSDPAETYTVG